MKDDEGTAFLRLHIAFAFRLVRDREQLRVISNGVLDQRRTILDSVSGRYFKEIATCETPFEIERSRRLALEIMAECECLDQLFGEALGLSYDAGPEFQEILGQLRSMRGAKGYLPDMELYAAEVVCDEMRAASFLCMGDGHLGDIFDPCWLVRLRALPLDEWAMRVEVARRVRTDEQPPTSEKPCECSGPEVYKLESGRLEHHKWCNRCGARWCVMPTPDVYEGDISVQRMGTSRVGTYKPIHPVYCTAEPFNERGADVIGPYYGDDLSLRARCIYCDAMRMTAAEAERAPEVVRCAHIFKERTQKC